VQLYTLTSSTPNGKRRYMETEARVQGEQEEEVEDAVHCRCFHRHLSSHDQEHRHDACLPLTQWTGYCPMVNCQQQLKHCCSAGHAFPCLHLPEVLQC
jgi:hypothetical protein